MDFPFLFSLYSFPGNDPDILESFGFNYGIWEVFRGTDENRDDDVTLYWGTEAYDIESKYLKKFTSFSDNQLYSYL